MNSRGRIPQTIAYHMGEYPRVTDTFIQREVAALRQRGIDVVTCSVRQTSAEHHIGREQQEEAARTFYVQRAARSPLRLLAAHLRASFRSPVRYGAAIRLAWRLAWPGLKGRLWNIAYFLEAGVLTDELRRRGVQHLHNHGGNSSCSVALLAATMGGIGFSFTEHGSAIFFEAAKWRLDLKAAHARFVACISDFCRSQVMLFSRTEHWQKMHVVHCGVDPTLFQARRHQNPARQVLFIGRLVAVKGLPFLIEAWARIARQFPEVVLKVVGDGPDRQCLERRTVQLGLADRVVITGNQSQEQVRAHLRESDLFVMASFAEGVPVVAMESLAAGVPVVATRVGGMTELVEEGVTGLLVPPGNADALAEALAHLLDDAATRQRYGAAGRAKVEREFDVTCESGKLCRLFMGILGDAEACTIIDPLETLKESAL